MSKLSNVLAKLNNIDTSGFALKTKYNADKTKLENKVPGISNLATKTLVKKIETKIPDISNPATKALVNKIENIISDISNLATKTALTTVENKIPDISNLVKKADYNTKITKIENKLNNELNKLKTFDSGYFIGKSHFNNEDGTQNYLVFQPLNKYFKSITKTDYVSSWKSKGLSSESIKPPTTSDNSLATSLNYYGTKTKKKFTRSCFKQSKVSYTHRKVVSIYIVFELGASSSNYNDPTLKNCLSGAVTLTKNSDIDEYGYFGYRIRFDRRSSYSSPGCGFGQNIIMFGVDMSYFIHIDNKKKTF